MSKRSTVSVKSSTADYALGGIAILGAIYLLTRKPSDGAGGSNTYKESVFEKITNGLSGATSGATSDIVGNVAELPGKTVVETSKKLVTNSEQKVSTQVFADQPRSDVSGWFATGGSGKKFSQPVTYQEFIQEQPLAVRVPVTAGNIITGNNAAAYGKFVADETKKGVALAGVETPEQMNKRFTRLDPWQQSLIGLGQAVTVPFGGGGAIGWAESLVKKNSNWRLPG